MNDMNTFKLRKFDYINKGLYIVNNQKRYVYSNDSFLRFVGVSREELIGHTVHEFRDKGRYDICVSDIVFREKNPVSMFGNISVNNNGVIRYERIMINATPMFDHNDNIEYVYAECELVSHINSRFQEATARNFSFERLVFNTPLTEQFEPKSTIPIIAKSVLMKKVLTTSKLIASVDTTILISGASGTGKELIAKYIHDNSSRKEYPMVIINCASIPENLIESNFFGYEKGSFSGGLPTGKKGLIEEADKGTLFLDEINSLPLGLQGKLLRAIETKKIQRIGSSKEISVNFRLLAATNEDLSQKVLNGTFRSDLFYRINILPIILPSLAERREDIIPLTQYFNEMYCEKYKKTRIFSSEALNLMVLYDWPGNIRELRNAIERAVLLTDHEYIVPSDIDSIIGMQKNKVAYKQFQEPDDNSLSFKSLLDNKVSLQKYLDECEKNYISAAFKEYGSTYKVASALNTTQSLVMRRKNKYRL